MITNATKGYHKENQKVPLEDTTRNSIEAYVESCLESMNIETNHMNQLQLRSAAKNRCQTGDSRRALKRTM